MPWFPPGLEIRENLEKWEGIFQSGNFVKTGNVRVFYSKYCKNQKKLYWKIEKNTGKVGNLSASNSENPVNMVPYFKQKMNFKKYWKTVKNTGKVREICQSEKVGTMKCFGVQILGSSLKSINLDRCGNLIEKFNFVSTPRKIIIPIANHHPTHRHPQSLHTPSTPPPLAHHPTLHPPLKPQPTLPATPTLSPTYPTTTLSTTQHHHHHPNHPHPTPSSSHPTTIQPTNTHPKNPPTTTHGEKLGP